MKYSGIIYTNKILAITSGLLLLLFASCKKVLIESPKSLAVENFYNTPAEIESAIGAIYLPLRNNMMPNYYATLECQSDYGYGRGSWAQMNLFQGLNDVNITRVSGFWNALYLSIRDANLVIANTPNGNSISKEDIDKYVAEAKFMRALDYFHLVRNWGQVPLRTESNMTEINLKKSSTDEIYNLIIADLQEAETNLPDQPALPGKPSKWAAKTMLADVYLQVGKFPEARDKSKEVIQSNKYSLVPVTSTADFQKIFGPDVMTTSEEIFYFKYSRQINQGNYMLWITNHPSTHLFSFGGAYAIYSDATNPVYKNWDMNDFRKGMWQQVSFGLGATTLVSSKYIDSLAISQNGAGNDLPMYRYAELLLIYAEAESRANNGPTAEAMEALNQVHRRAYGKNPTAPSSVDFNLADYNADSFLDLILKERGYEFQFEGKRWLTLRRTGKAQEIIQAVKGITIEQKDFLWPIPVSEMNYNKALDPKQDQNPGY